MCELEPPANLPVDGNQQQQPVGLTRLGMCAVDVASGHLLVGEFLDDEVGLVLFVLYLLGCMY